MRKIKLAVVGPQDSVALISELAEERKDALKIYPYVYRDAAEVPAIIEQYDEKVDLWLFSGKVPYNYAVAAKTSTRPLLYIPHAGSSLYRVLLQMKMDSAPMDKISFDTFSQKEIEETFVDIPMPLPEVFVNDYQGVVATSDITEYHWRLWESNKTQTAVTCVFSTYLELKKRGVPCYRIWPARHNIRTSLDNAIIRAEARRFKGSQIAIHHISIDEYDEFVRNSVSSYAVTKSELRLYELLVDYTERLQGSIVIHGNGQFTIYSTRGSVEDMTRSFTCMPIMDEIALQMKVSVSGGIGFGETVHTADGNAHVALGLARNGGNNRWMAVLDDGTVIGPLSSEMQIIYSIRSADESSLLMAKRLNVSVTTVNRLIAIFSKLDEQTIHADMLAQYLSITSRSARRLLGILVENDLARVIGEEVAGSGRPRKLYQIFVDKIIEKYQEAH